jgi:hypothetical protein
MLLAKGNILAKRVVRLRKETALITKDTPRIIPLKILLLPTVLLHVPWTNVHTLK